MKRYIALISLLLLSSIALGSHIYGQNWIKVTTAKTPGETINVGVETENELPPNIVGLEQNFDGEWVVKSQTFTIEGDVTILEVTNCKITHIEVSPNHTSLRELWANWNQLTRSLDLSSLPQLETVVLTSNKLTTLDLANCPKLSIIYADRNELSEINFSDDTSLSFVSVEKNKLEQLTFPEAPHLREISCYANQIKDSAMQRCIQSLPNLVGDEAGTLNIISTDSQSEGNVIYASDISIAEDKGFWCYDVKNSGERTIYGGLPDPTHSESEKITFTIGEDLVHTTQVMLLTGNGGVTIEGVEEPYSPDRMTYTFTQKDITITGQVTELTCSILGISQIDVTQAPSLKLLDCNSNNLTHLDLSKNVNLEGLDCMNNQLTELIIKGCTNLDWINCPNNKLQLLKIENCPKLTSIAVYLNDLSKEILHDLVTSLPELTEESPGSLYLVETMNSRISERNEYNLEDINTAKRKHWISYDWAGGQRLPIKGEIMPSDALITLTTSKKAGEKIAIEIIGSEEVVITGVEEPFAYGYSEYTLTASELKIQGDVSELICVEQQLTTLDISKSPKLRILHGYKNQLTSFTADGAPELKRIILSNNQLSAVKINNCPKLESISLWDNNLSDINLSQCPLLSYIDCMHNQISDQSFSNLIDAFPTISSSEGVLMCVDTEKEPKDANVINKATVLKATTKNWRIVDYANGKFGADGIPFEGSDVGIESPQQMALEIYPNPVCDYLIIPPTNQSEWISLYTSTGELLWQGVTATDGASIIDMRHTVAGSYLVVVGSQVTQIVKL